MHGEAYWFIEESLGTLVLQDELRVLEYGSRDVNGTPRTLFRGRDQAYLGIDIEPGPGVDIVGNAASLDVLDGGLFDVVICAEVAEHTPDWRKIVYNAYRHLVAGGLFVFTAATDPRLPHSAVDGHNMMPDEYSTDRDAEGVEWYQNIDPNELGGALLNAGFHGISVSTHERGDVYATAVV